MKARSPARLAWSLWAVSATLIIVALGISVSLNEADNLVDPLWLVILVALAYIVFPSIGALIASRQADNAIGWLLCTVGALFALGGTAEAYSQFALLRPRSSLPGGQFSAWLASWIFIPAVFLCGTFLLLLFPNGRLLSPRWRWVAGIGVATLLMLMTWTLYVQAGLNQIPRS